MEVKIKSYKVQRVGKRGLGLAIPVPWAETQNIGPGDKVDVFQNEFGYLIVKPQGART